MAFDELVVLYQNLLHIGLPFQLSTYRTMLGFKVEIEVGRNHEEYRLRLIMYSGALFQMV